MQITAAMVDELRWATQEPMMRCKQALTVSNGDMEAAKEWLRSPKDNDSLAVRVTILEKQLSDLRADFDRHGHSCLEE